MTPKENNVTRLRAQAAAVVALCALAAQGISAQKTATPDPIQWCKPVGHLQIGWEPIPVEFHQRDSIVLRMHIKVPDDDVKVKVGSTGTLDLYWVGVSYGPNHVPVAMTKEGMTVIDPNRSMGAKGVYMDGKMTKVDEILLSEWWDVSRPGSYTVSISHNQRAAGNAGGYKMITAPDVVSRVTP